MMQSRALFTSLWTAHGSDEREGSDMDGSYLLVAIHGAGALRRVQCRWYWTRRASHRDTVGRKIQCRDGRDLGNERREHRGGLQCAECRVWGGRTTRTTRSKRAVDVVRIPEARGRVRLVEEFLGA